MPKHVADGKLSIKLCLGLCLYSSINSIFKRNGDALLNKRLGYDNRMDNKRKLNQVFSNSPQGCRLRGRQKIDGGTVYKYILLNTKLQIGKRGQKTELNGRSPLVRRRSALECSAI